MAEYLENAVDSVLGGTFSDLEILIIDDGSTDATPERIQAYTDPSSSRHDTRVRCLQQSNRGKSHAINRAFQEARGQYFTILDADDILPPTSLESRYREVEKRSDAPDVVVGGLEVFRGGTTVSQRYPPKESDPEVIRWKFLMEPTTPFSLNNCLIRRDAIRATGDFDPALRRVQDVDYALRLFRHVSTVVPISEIVYRYRKHRSGVQQRLRMRLWTVLYRVRVVWKNTEGQQRLIVTLYNVALDLAKLLYELCRVY
jgi:glycosyltransferase involved in cell wall biosynthesis